MKDIISNEFIKLYKGTQPNWGFGDLSYVTYKRTYAREIKGENRTEEWYETIQRVINGAQELGAGYSLEEAERLFKYMWEFKGLYAGRMLAQLGTGTVKKIGSNSLLNCWFCNIKSIDSILFLFDNLMLGGGVGFSIKREHIYKFPYVKKGIKIELKNTKDADFIVPDSREGWIELLKKVLESFWINGKSFTYSTLLIRGYGEKIETFGGQASGPLPLIEGISDICKIFIQREGKQARSIDLLDICNILGRIVDSANVRRGAEIALGDVDDMLFLQAKRWDRGNIPNWRAKSNNSVYCSDINHLPPAFWEGYKGNGEPYGLVNINLAKRRGRLNDIMQDNCEGFNPCGEATLADGECCDLFEQFLNNIENLEEFIDVLLLLYKAAKCILNNRFLHDITSEIVKKNQRIGGSITGICQSFDKKIWLDTAYNALKKYDEKWSNERGWNKSIKLTVVKPSGTLSLLAGSTPGIHPGFAPYYYRTMRMSSDSLLANYCRERGYKIEYVENFDKSVDRNTIVVYFPISLKNCLYAKDTSAIKQLELVKEIQTLWSDQAVSVTVYYKLEELEEIREWLRKNYNNSIKSVSFLLHSEHGFSQAVYQEIAEEEYLNAIQKLKPVEMNLNVLDKEPLSSDCEGGSCGLNEIIKM